MLVIGGTTFGIFGFVVFKLSANLMDYIGVFGIAMTHFQVAAVMMSIKLELPDAFVRVMKWCQSIFGAMIFDFFFSPECQGDFTFYETWAAVTFLPMVGVLILVALGWKGVLEWNLAMRMSNLALLILYVFELKQAWKLLDCVELEDGSYVLEDDPSVVCTETISKDRQVMLTVTRKKKKMILGKNERLVYGTRTNK